VVDPRGLHEIIGICEKNLKYEKVSGQYLVLICDEQLTYIGLNLNPESLDGFVFIFISCGESCLLASWCAGDRCGMVWWTLMRIVPVVEDLVQRIRMIKDRSGTQ
jgi:hypothetical protein